MEARTKARDRRFCRPIPQMKRGARSANLNAPREQHYGKSKDTDAARRVKVAGAIWQN